MSTHATGLRDFSLLLACLCLLSVPYLVSSCAGSRPAPTTEQPAATPDARLQLPAPADLPRITSQTGQGSLLGSQFVPELPHNRVTVTGDSALFDPVGEGRLADAAYAAYRLSVLAPEEVHPSLDLGWTAAEQPLAGCWLALANWQSDCWDWHYVPNNHSVGPTSHLSLLDFAAYLKNDSGVGCLYAIALVDSAAPARLMWLRLGAGWSGGSIAAAATDPPRSLELELVPSPDDGSLVNVDWDFESDGTIDAHSLFATTHTYAESDIYKITAYLTDVDGTLRITEKSVPVSPWRIENQPLETEPGSAEARLDDAGEVQLAFLRDPDGDGQGPYDLLAATNAAGSWTEEPVCQVSRLSQPVLAAADGQVHIILLDDPGGARRDVLVHAWREADEWQHTQLVDDEYYAGGRPDLALDSTGTVHVAYFGRGQSDNSARLRYATSTTGFSFSSVPLPAAAWDGLALALDSADQPHLACTVYLGYEQVSCAYAHWDGAQWNAELVGAPACDCAAADILIDDLEQPNLLYESKERNQGIPPYWYLRLGTKTSGGWQFADFSPIEHWGAGPNGNWRMALAAGGQVMLARGIPYYAGDWGSGATNFVYHAGSAWRYEVLEYLTHGGTLFSFGLDRQGRPWLCYDGTQVRLATRLE